MHKFLLFLLVTIFSQNALHAQCEERFKSVLSDTFELHTDLVYGSNITSSGEQIELLLDVYEPVGEQEGLRPLVILAHGGSFNSGSKEMNEVTWFCEDLARRGIVAVSINYRLEESILSLISKEQMVKAVIRAVEDFKAAIRFMHKDAIESNTWNVDPESIFMGGTSAGSIAALHTAYMDEYSTLLPSYQQWIQDLGIDTVDIAGNSGNPGYREDVAGIINISGAISELNFMDNNVDLPILSAHNTVDLSVPFKIGRPYFLPTLPLVAGSKPINYRIRELGGDSRLLVYPAINHVPHTDYDGGKLENEYAEILNAMLSLIGEYASCDIVLGANTEDQLPELVFFPNPASKFLKWNGVSGNNIQQIKLINLAGVELKTYATTELMSGSIQLPDQLTGMYLLEILASDGRKTTRKILISN